MDKGDIGLMRLNIDCSIILIVLFLFTSQQTSSEEPILRRHRELDAQHPVLPRDTRSATASTRNASLLTAPNSKYCAKLTDSVEYTTCTMCAVSNLQVQEDSMGNVCPLHKRPTGRATRGCIAGYFPVFSFEGCNFECVDSDSDFTECCPGYWGPHCSECLGGPLYPCSSHGKCDDGRNGTGECICDDGYTGTACDICTGNSCSEKQMCIYNYDCRTGAYCEFRSREDSYCQCLDGYHGDGVNCHPINPCMENSYHCPSSTSLCVYDGPNKYHCECKPGYSEFQVGCFQDECQGNNVSCVPGAECATITSIGSGKLTIGLGEEGDGEMARVIHTDLVASNGVIHIIDRVLLPPDDVSTRAQMNKLAVT
ncbi:stabilin-2-like [Lytechinus variegatus]|uniref:stabilin-2-like n=1 Tax=Lytechinus variegatus TaxID=7654 RepID=UPI001BB19542|nr:stabilin-2-like [Lytechinus variegatus]